MWLLPALVAVLSSTGVLVAVYLYLYLQEKKDFLLIWTGAWAVYALRYLFALLLAAWGGGAALLAANQLAALLSGLLLLWGTYRFLERGFPRLWLWWSWPWSWIPARAWCAPTPLRCSRW